MVVAVVVGELVVVAVEVEVVVVVVLVLVVVAVVVAVVIDFKKRTDHNITTTTHSLWPWDTIRGVQLARTAKEINSNKNMIRMELRLVA